MADSVPVYEHNNLRGFFDASQAKHLGTGAPEDPYDTGCPSQADLLQLPGGLLVLADRYQSEAGGNRWIQARIVTVHEAVEWLIRSGHRPPDDLLKRTPFADFTHAPEKPELAADDLSWLTESLVQPTAPPYNSGPDPPGPPFSLPGLCPDLHAIHYSQELQANSPAQTPPVSAIVVQNVLTGQQLAFAAFRIAEQRGLSPCEVAARFPELEKQVLSDFYDFVASHPSAVWLHWAMRQPRFGFEVLAQRARLHQLSSVEIPAGRLFDLSSHLKRVYGEDFVPHPRLPNAMRRNGLGGPDVLDEGAAKEAWAKGEHARLLVSLSCKVDAIADLFERVHSGTFKTGAPGPDGAASQPPPEPAVPSCPDIDDSGPVIASAPASEGREAKGKGEPSPKVELRGLDQRPIVLGKEKPLLTERAYNVVVALLQAGTNGLTKDLLDKKSGHSEARKVLQQLRESDEDWAAVIRMPGKAGRGGYRVV